MRKSSFNFTKVAIGIGSCLGILYLCLNLYWWDRRDKVWSKVSAYATKYSIEHPEVTQEQLNSWTYALYDEALKKEGLYQPE